jgi:dTDP-4-dehydrorhamnose reductase
VDGTLEQHRPWAVLNAAGYVRVDDAEHEPDRCFRENAIGPAVLARACAERGIRFLTFSSDLVFDGRQRAPYLESDPVSPLNIYGRSKAEAEKRVLDVLPTALVIRTSAFFGPWDDYNFVTKVLRALQRGESFPATEDAVVSPTYVPDLAHACLDLLIDGERGIWHLANAGAASWADFARRAAVLAGLDPLAIRGCLLADMALPAPRPPYSVLGSERGTLLPQLDDALRRYFEDRREEPRRKVRRRLSAKRPAAFAAAARGSDS